MPLPSVPKGSPFEQFFEDSLNGAVGRTISASVVAGVRLRHRCKEGLVVTNNHVIDGADEIIINFLTEPSSRSTGARRDTKTDLALLKARRRSRCAGRVRQFDHAQGRRLGDGDRQSVRARRLGDGRHHLG